MICLDASIVVKLVLNEEWSDQAKSLYRAALSSQTMLVAPPLLPIEVTNIIRKQMRGETGLALTDATVYLEDLLALAIEIHNPPGLHLAALAIANACGLPATYDAHYLALAEFLNCEFWTADWQLYRQAERHLPFVRWIGDHQRE
jgi:predicted nucleic acid-binding protein